MCEARSRSARRFALRTPLKKPAIHSGLMFSILLVTIGLGVIDVKGKLYFKLSDKPQFKDALLYY